MLMTLAMLRVHLTCRTLVLRSGVCLSRGTDSVSATDTAQKCGPAVVVFIADRQHDGLASADSQSVPSTGGCCSLGWEPLPPPPARLPYTDTIHTPAFTSHS